MLPLIAVAWWLRLATEAPYTIGTDGGLSVGLAVGPLHQLFDFNARDVHPPLYYLLLRLWVAPAGLSWLSLKWLGAAGGIIGGAATARWATSAAGRSGGVAALIALALAPSAVIAGASVRDFSLGLGATMVAVLAFWMAVKCPGSMKARIALGIATAVAGLSWYFHLPVFAVQLALALLWRPAERARVPLLIGAAAWLPWLAIAGPPLLAKLAGSVNSFGGNAVNGGRPTAEIFAVAGGWYPGAVPSAIAAAAALTMAGLGLYASFRHGCRRFAALWLACAAAGGVMLWYVNRHWDPQAGVDRYGLVVLPFLAAGASALSRHWKAGLAVVAVWIAVSLPSLAPMPHSTPPQPWYPDPALDLVLQHWQPGDAVALESIDRQGYFAVRGGAVQDSFAAEDNGSAFRALGARRRIGEAVPELEATHARIWYVQDKEKPGKLLMATLDSSSKLIQQWNTPTGIVRLYATSHIGDAGTESRRGWMVPW